MQIVLICIYWYGLWPTYSHNSHRQAATKTQKKCTVCLSPLYLAALSGRGIRMSITLTAVITNVSLNVTVELCVSPLILPQHVQLKNHGIRGICSAEVSKSFADRIRYMFDLNSIYVLYTWFNSTRCVHPRPISAAEFDRGGGNICCRRCMQRRTLCLRRGVHIPCCCGSGRVVTKQYRTRQQHQHDITTAQMMEARPYGAVVTVVFEEL